MKKAIALVLSSALLLSGMPALANSTTTSMGIGKHNFGVVQRDGTLWMWGCNEYGEFGDGTVSRSSDLFDFRQSAAGVAAVACGYYNSTAILKTDGSLWVAGRNNFGQLGNGTRSDCALFIKLADNVAKVGAGDGYFIFLKKDGSLWGVGSGSNMVFARRYDEDQLTPVKIMDGVRNFSTSCRHTGAISVNNELYMFGSNVNGALGIGNDSDSYDMTQPVKVLDNVRSVSCGTDYTLAVKSDDTLWSWGKNDYAQLLNGHHSYEANYVPAYAPAKVLDRVAKACAGADNSAYITTDGTLYMAGRNLNGELGFDGLNQTTVLPIKIAENVEDVAVCDITAYTTKDGRLFMCGSNTKTIGTLNYEFVEKPYSVAAEAPVSIDSARKRITLQIGSRVLNNNGAEVMLDVPAQIVNGSTLVPLRAIFESLGATVDWDGATRTVTSVKGDTTVKLTIGSDVIYKNGTAKKLNTPAQSIGGRTMVPVRAVAESFGAHVSWDGATKTVTIVYE